MLAASSAIAASANTNLLPLRYESMRIPWKLPKDAVSPLNPFAASPASQRVRTFN